MPRTSSAAPTGSDGSRPDTTRTSCCWMLPTGGTSPTTSPATWFPGLSARARRSRRAERRYACRDGLSQAAPPSAERPSARIRVRLRGRGRTGGRSRPGRARIGAAAPCSPRRQARRKEGAGRPFGEESGSPVVEQSDPASRHLFTGDLLRADALEPQGIARGALRRDRVLHGVLHSVHVFPRLDDVPHVPEAKRAGTARGRGAALAVGRGVDLGVAAVVPGTGPRSEEEEDPRALVARNGVALVRLEGEQRSGVRVERLSAGTDPNGPIDDEHESVLLHLMLAELLACVEPDQDCAGRFV